MMKELREKRKLYIDSVGKMEFESKEVRQNILFHCTLGWVDFYFKHLQVFEGSPRYNKRNTEFVDFGFKTPKGSNSFWTKIFKKFGTSQYCTLGHLKQPENA